MKIKFNWSGIVETSSRLHGGTTVREVFALGAVAAILSAGLPAMAQPAIAVDAQGEYARGRLIVMARPGLSDDELGKVVGVHGGRARAIGRTGLFVVDLPAQASETAVAQRLAHDPKLKFAELDRRVPPALVPNDPYLGSAWHLYKIGATSIWDSSMGSGVTIAILDTGVDGSHPDLAANMVPGWNAFKNNSDTSDFMGHGTPVAGAAAAVSNNGIGDASVAGRSKIMPIVITDASGGSFYSVIAQGITYAADRGARVASISFSGLPFSSAIQSAAQYMKNKGGLVVVAAGNTGAIDNVASTTTMIPVAATLSNDSRASWSTYGSFVAMSAPGDGIESTGRGGVYGTYGGTSLATPIVSATIALMMAANPSLSATAVENLLYKTAVDLGTAGRDVYYGHGRVNAAAAVSAAVNASTTAPPADTTAPTVTISAPLGGSAVSGTVPVNISAGDNVGVSKVELRVNGVLIATDTISPFAFSWNSSSIANASTTLLATAYDAAGNSSSSPAVTVAVTNGAAPTGDTTPPSVTLLSPSSTTLTGNSTTIVANATDNAGQAGITLSLYIDGVLKSTSLGGSLSYKWSLRKVARGQHELRVTARDNAGNASNVSRQVTK